MASDRTRELATKWRKEFEAKHRGTTLDEEKLATLLDDALAALLDAFERETRLDEAKLWCHNWYGYDNLGLSGQALETHRENCRDCQRVADLAAQPTPEVKK